MPDGKWIQGLAPEMPVAEAKVRAAWLYYVEGLTQEQIAEALGLSRIKVIRMLAAARSEGLVKIRIDARSARRCIRRATARRMARLSCSAWCRRSCICARARASGMRCISRVLF